MPPRFSSAGFSFIEMVITVTITGIIFAAIAIPSLNVLSGTKSQGCLNNIQAIESAKANWCAEHPAAFVTIQGGGSGTLTLTDLFPTVSANPSVTNVLLCPVCGSNSYQNWNVIGVKTTCPSP
jgi:prepilin-type N-terminal cleavage/methylation domain-containing protein